MSNIIKLKNSHNWYARFMYQGKTYQKSLKTTNKRLAEQLATQYYQEVISTVHNLGDNTISINDALEGYFKTTKKDRGCRNQMNFFKKWIIQITDIQASVRAMNTAFFESVVELRREEGKSPGTIAQDLAYLSRVVKWAKNNGFAVSEYELPKIKNKNQRLRYLNEEEEKALLLELEPFRKVDKDDNENKLTSFYQDNYDVCVLLLDTGARLNEILKLEWKSVNLAKGTISLYRSKVGNESILYMTSRVKEILKRRNQFKDSEFIFTNREGDSPKSAVGGIRRAIARAGLKDVTIHTLRHTCASKLIQSGMQLYEVSKILGHSNVTMTSRYAHLSTTDVSKKARDILDDNSTTFVGTSDIVQLKNPHESLYNSLSESALDISFIDTETLFNNEKSPTNIVLKSK